MSITLRKEDPLKTFANAVDVLVDEAGFSNSRLVNLRKLRTEQGVPLEEDPDIGRYAEITAGYFSLAVETQGVLAKLARIESRDVPPTLIRRIPAETRETLVQLANGLEIPVDTAVLDEHPFLSAEAFTLLAGSVDRP